MSIQESASDLTDPTSPFPPPGFARLPILKALTSIRFFAAMHVALFHLVRPFSLWGPLEPLISVGYVGVSFFFFLSGFILTYSHAQEYESGKGSAVRFWVARFARIYPVYLLSMIFAAYVGSYFFSNRLHILAYVADLLMVQSWSVRMVSFFHVTAWSLSSEAFFYLVFPFLLLRLRPRSPAKAILAVAGFWACATIAPLICLWLYPSAVWTGHGPGDLQVFRVLRLPILALPEFLAGVSLGWLFLRFPPRRSWSAALALTGAGAYIAASFLSHHFPNVLIHNGLFIPVYAAIILGLAEANWVSRLLSAGWLVLLGEASFALYLFHFLFNDWTMQHFGAGHGFIPAAWKLAIIVPVSVGLHVWVERPARRMILRRWNARSAAA